MRADRVEADCGRCWSWLVLPACLIMGCGGPDQADTGAGVFFEGAAMDWLPGDPSVDPLGGHQPLDASCPAGSWGVEDQVLEIESGLCHYAWLVQPLPERFEAGATLQAALWHTGLDASEPAEAHVALLVGDQVIWEAHSAIPADPESWTARGVLSAPVESGALVGLHLHNHGDNSWRLGPVSLQGQP